MEQKSQDFSIREAQRLAKTPEGQRLMDFLQHRDSARLQEVMEAASSGHYQQAGTLLSSLLTSPEARALLQELGKQHG